MELTTLLRQDHALLRKKLTMLESALQVAPEARFVLREVGFSLRRILHEHMTREARALQLYHQRTPAGADPLRVADHADAQHLLREVGELLLGGMRASIPPVLIRFSHVIDRLRAQMDEQEGTVFRFLDHAEESPTDDAHTSISGAMSVNEIVQRYPSTERVFEQLHINRPREGYESVDELAWRYGMDVSQFIEQLRHVATSLPAN